MYTDGMVALLVDWRLQSNVVYCSRLNKCTFLFSEYIFLGYLSFFLTFPEQDVYMLMTFCALDCPSGEWVFVALDCTTDIQVNLNKITNILINVLLYINFVCFKNVNSFYICIYVLILYIYIAFILQALA